MASGTGTIWCGCERRSDSRTSTGSRWAVFCRCVPGRGARRADPGGGCGVRPAVASGHGQGHRDTGPVRGVGDAGLVASGGAVDRRGRCRGAPCDVPPRSGPAERWGRPGRGVVAADQGPVGPVAARVRGNHRRAVPGPDRRPSVRRARAVRRGPHGAGAGSLAWGAVSREPAGQPGSCQVK